MKCLVKIIDKNIYVSKNACMDNLEKLAKILIDNNLVISTAESCTGGLVSSMLTDLSGSSAYTKLNFVTYSNQAKHKVLGVSDKTLINYGAVSEECAREMAEGLMHITECDIALCTTGIAGPTGGDENKPVGLIYISVKYNGKTTVKKFLFDTTLNRKDMKRQFAKSAINLALEVVTSQ